MSNSNTSDKNRASSLLELSIDYDEDDKILSRFSELMCLVSGSMYSQINLIDDENQWTIAECGMDFEHIPAQESICYITINNEDTYEIKDFNKDDKFHNHPLVTGVPHLKYYLGFPFKDEKGIYVGSTCLLHTETLDLSDQQKESLKLINKQVADYLIFKKEFNNQTEKVKTQEGLITKTRHDIRGPLSGIIGFSSLMEVETSNSVLLKNVSMIKQSAKNLLEYAEKTLRSRLEKNEDTATASVSSIIERIDSLYAMQSKLKEIKLTYENHCDDDCSINTFSSNQIINIVGNAVSNAIKFSPAKSSVKLSFEKFEQGEDHYVKISVLDNGTGIPKDKLKSLRKLEFVESAKTDSDVSGFGIGLIEALRLLDKKSGHFTISSTVKKGTKVELNFPIVEE